MADLGGEDRLSTQELALVDLAVRDRLLLESVDAWLFEQPRLVNARRKAVYPAVVERQKLAEGFTRRLQALGFQRRSRPTPSLQEYLAGKAGNAEGYGEADSEPRDSACEAEGRE